MSEKYNNKKRQLREMEWIKREKEKQMFTTTENSERANTILARSPKIKWIFILPINIIFLRHTDTRHVFR